MKKLEDWINLSMEEKLLYNGYSGFLKGERFINGNAFFTQEKSRKEHRRLVESKMTKL